MVVNKSLIINSALILALTAPLAIADADNNLVQLDLKRSSANAVDVTLVTSESYGDNVLVRKKSDNKYVILIPQVRSAGYNASNLSGVRDLVSNVDVKTVDDTSGGYTKVTLITTKPLDIKTKTIKSKPITADQREYNTLIAQANAVKNTISTQEPPKIRDKKTEITVDKAPKQAVSQQKQEIKQQTQPHKVDSKKQDSANKKAQDIKLSSIAPEDIERQNRKTHLADLIKEAKQEKALEELPQSIPADDTKVASEEIKDIKDLPATPKVSFIAKIKSGISKISNKIPSKLPKAIGFSILGLFILSILSQIFKRTVAQIGNYYINNLADISPEQSENITDNSHDINDIANDNNLSWKEKYQRYIDKSAAPVARANNKGNYSFIKRPSAESIEAKRQELEKLVSKNDTESFNINEDSNLYSEDSSISKTIKFKAFENSLNSLNMSKRNRIKSRFKKYEVEIPLHEQKTIILDDSPLSTNRRSLKGANLEVSDVDKRQIKYQPKEYIMSSVDEYLNILDSEKSNIIEKNQNTKKVSTNPIAKQKEDAYLKGSVIKSGFQISPNKGFYLVNKDGKNSLIGKINDNITVIKKFDTNITNPIQVRRDNGNVYMVKAGGFKSLVEVNDDNMGVLIEL